MVLPVSRLLPVRRYWADGQILPMSTKRYRSNLINWGMLPFLIPEGELPFKNGDYLFVPEIRKAVEEKAESIQAYVVAGKELKPFELKLGALTDDEREIILKGCLINYYRG